ncbi:6-phosphogluconate phosphatase [Budvicia diplopodorum]|uniref:6-phosphogluconate phosphatase n=1 Tax=Budvicia diplopodorum TaxID=1119056 RepID=UPI001356DF52|nr:6-phosphogluconate phosphatase [Budvicia diplopodorum]
MQPVECVLFDSDGTLVDSEILCCESFSNVFKSYGISLSTQECIKQFKGTNLYKVFAQVRETYGLDQPDEKLEKEYRQDMARLFELSLQPIQGIRTLLEGITVPMAVVSNGPVTKMQHSLGLTKLINFFGDHLYSAFDIQRWKPDPALLRFASDKLSIPLEKCILIEDSLAGAHAGIAAGIPVFYYCADQHNTPIDHPLVTTFHDMAELPELWKARGWDIYRA